MTRVPLLIALMLAIVTPTLAGIVHVAGASNFHHPLRQLARSFEAQTGHRVRISTASTGKLYAQIRHGAPYQLFLAADQKRPAQLEREGLAVPGSRFTYALGRLALWAPRQPPRGEPGALMARTDLRRFAIANPKTAPYGAAARQTLQAMGLWQQLQGRLVRGENIAQTRQFIASGAAEMGLIADTQLSEQERAEGYYWLVPAALYRPIRQDAILLRRGADSPAARAFLAFLQSPDARTLIRRLGYGPDTP